jgi:hypothetical protein
MGRQYVRCRYGRLQRSRRDAHPGWRRTTAESHLAERYLLLDGGARLSVVFTWEDAKVFQKPHTYEFRYYKIGPLSGSRILPCDPGD